MKLMEMKKAAKSVSRIKANRHKKSIKVLLV